MSDTLKTKFNNKSLNTSSSLNNKDSENVFTKFINYIKSLFNSIFNQNTQQSVNYKNNSVSIDKKVVGSEFIAIFGLLLVIVVCIFIGYGLYIVLSRNLYERSSYIVEETKTPILCNKLTILPLNEMNKTSNGQRRTFTFWMYINDLNKYNGSYKRVLHIGDDSGIYNASPYIFLDKTENKLYIRFSKKTNKENKDIASLHELENLDEFMSSGIEIPYIPIQRWVHISVVINETSKKGSITAYIDGELSNTVTTNEYSNAGTIYDIKDLNINKTGSIYIGGSTDSTEGVGFSGLISKFTTYNYDLNSKDIYDDYNKGPMSGLLYNIGLGSYGVRNPIYKIS